MLTETSTDDDRERLARVLTPAAPPRVLEHVYTDDQYRRLLDVVQRHGPWPTITAHHFDSVDELVATIVGFRPEGPRPHARRHRDRALSRFLRPELGLLLPGDRRLLLQPHVHRSREVVLGCAVRQADDDALQHLRTAPQRAQPAPRRHHLPRRPIREHAGVAPEHHGEVGSVLGLHREDGSGHHVVVPRRGRHVHLLARRSVASRRSDSTRRCGTAASSCRTS